MSADRLHLTTDRLRLEAPVAEDLEELHTIYADPRVWEHFPSHVHTSRERTRVLLATWIVGWDRQGLDQWMVRGLDDDLLLGHCGCSVRPNAFWNLGYRFSPEAQGRGYATEVARIAVREANTVRPDLPVVAFLLEHNVASGNVARKTGLALHHRGPDAGNPDPDAVRMVYADRALTEGQLAVAMS